MPDFCRKKAFVLQQNRSFSRSCLQLLSLFQRYFPRRRLFNAGDYGFVWSEYFCICPVLVDPLVTAQKNLYVRHFVFTFCSVSSKVFSAVCSRDRRCAGPFFSLALLLVILPLAGLGKHVCKLNLSNLEFGLLFFPLHHVISGTIICES